MSIAERPDGRGAGSDPQPSSPRKWHGRTRGGYLGNWIFVVVLRVLGLRAAYAILFFLCIYYMLFAPRAVAASLEYLKRRFGYGLCRRLPLTWLHFYTFGKLLLDRVAIIRGQGEGFELIGDECQQIADLLEEGNGVILLNAHVGAWEAAAHLLGERDITVNVVMYEGEVEQVRKLMDTALAGRKFNLIPVTGSFADSVAIMAALRRGEVVAMLGDRAFSGRAVEVDFLGSPARFPVGPYAVAAATGAPLFHVFCGRQKYRSYRFYAFPATQIVRDRRRSRDEQYRECAGEFVRHMEWFLERHPMQWSNFYRFWSKAAASA